MTRPQILTVLDTKAGGITDVPLADLAADIRRYEILAPADGGADGNGQR
jgi:hypothetical protein